MMALQPKATTPARLLLLLAICGEYPHRSPTLSGSIRTLEELVGEVGGGAALPHPRRGRPRLLQNAHHQRKGETRRTIRLYKSALPLLQALHPAALDWYLAATGGRPLLREYASHVEQKCAGSRNQWRSVWVPAWRLRPFLLPPLQKRAIRQTAAGRRLLLYRLNPLEQLDNAAMNKTILHPAGLGRCSSPGFCYAVYNTRDAVMK